MHHHLEGHKDLTNHKDPIVLAEPDDLWIPLVNGNAPCTPLVSAGDEVKVGTKIAERNDHFYVPLYSPVSGKVVGVEKRMTAAMKNVDHLHIQSDHQDTTEKPFAPLDYETADWQTLEDFLKNSGMQGLGGAGFPTYVKYLKPENIQCLIINGVECEPYLTADYRNMMNNLELLKVGTLAFFKLSKAQRVCVSVKEDKADLIAELKKTFEGTPVEIRTVPDIYPAGWERTLVWLLEHKRYDRLPAEAGCIVDNASTAIAFGDALQNGMPITRKVVTVSGDAVKDPHNVIATVGTPASALIEACGGYTEENVVLAAGGPMMGMAIPNDKFVIGVPNNGLTVLKYVKNPDIKCLRCGKCTEVCPSGLEPVRINNAEKVKDIETLKKLDTQSCIECGLCSYICPSRIDVTEGIRRAKRYMALVKK